MLLSLCFSDLSRNPRRLSSNFSATLASCFGLSHSLVSFCGTYMRKYSVTILNGPLTRKGDSYPSYSGFISCQRTKKKITDKLATSSKLGSLDTKRLAAYPYPYPYADSNMASRFVPHTDLCVYRDQWCPTRAHFGCVFSAPI